MATKIAVLLAVVMAALMLNGASAQMMTGQSGVCCAFILDSANKPVLVCDQPSRVRALFDGRTCSLPLISILFTDTCPQFSTIIYVQVPGSKAMPKGTVISGRTSVTGQIAQCVGR